MIWVIREGLRIPVASHRDCKFNLFFFLVALEDSDMEKFNLNASETSVGREAACPCGEKLLQIEWFENSAIAFYISD